MHCPAHRSSPSFIKLLTISSLSTLLLISRVDASLAQVQSVTQTVSTSNSSTSADQVQITAIPPRLGEDFSLKAKPGQTIQTSVRVKNSSSQPLTLKSLVEDFIIGEDGKEPIPVQEETPSQWSLAKWMTITPPINTLQPNQSALINVLIEVPADALPGGRYAMIMHQPTTAEGLGGGAAAGVSQRVGTLLYFMVEGEVHEEAYIRDIKVKNFFENGPVPFSFVIENRSDIHIRPKVEVEIQNMFGQQVGTLALDPQNIFPYTERTFASEWNQHWGLGKYTATLSASYGSQGKIVTGVFSFWMIPVKLILAIGFGIMSLLTILVFFKRKATKKSIENKKEIETLKAKVKSLETEKLHSFKDEQN